MENKYLDRTKREYSETQRGLFMLFLAPIFLGLLPYGFIALGGWLNRTLLLPSLAFPPYHWIVGGALMIPGAVFAIWSIYAQFTLGRGTPVPLLPTHKLIVTPPFTYCRNPMTLGTLLMYLGLAVAFGSLGAALLVLLFVALLLVYIKRLEEKELELRFGQEYLDYKRRTPFIIPRFRKLH